MREKTLVWTGGLEDWQPASDFKIFASASDAYLEEDADEYWEEDLQGDQGDQEDQEKSEWVPPQKAAPKKKPQTVNESIRPWARFFARKIDIALFFLGLDFLSANIGSFAFTTPFYQGVFLILGFLCLEPLLLVAFGVRCSQPS
ncbi:MAG: hypothetical protein O3A95_09400 [Planctomycetota bacterium]|nr:hypothetical protein [Planctomycetota bacterium]MDA1114496.1 hypothetical protein [Planctomycetota bacterium]